MPKSSKDAEVEKFLKSMEVAIVSFPEAVLIYAIH